MHPDNDRDATMTKIHRLDQQNGFNIVGARELQDQALRTVEKKKDAAEKSYLLYSKFSYALYFIGWGLGLIGSLFGVKGFGEGD